ncbi:unnamed protein product [Amoebophrya sp. A120]|nr:unnamed protein product [Amoebophrya sp. A120]|eukprot:GSA120T00011445001.1
MFRDAGSGRIIPPREATRNSSVSGPDTDMPAMIAYRDYLKQCAGMRFVFDDWYDVDASQTIDHAGEEIEEVLGL